MRVTCWIDAKEAEDKKKSIGGMGGWFGIDMEKKDAEGRWGKAHHRWNDYIEAIKPETREYAEAIRESVLANNIKTTGAEHQNDADGVPLFEDGTVGEFSMRAWGDIMAAVWSEAENKDYTYLDFYC